MTPTCGHTARNRSRQESHSAPRLAMGTSDGAEGEAEGWSTHGARLALESGRALARAGTGLDCWTCRNARNTRLDPLGRCKTARTGAWARRTRTTARASTAAIRQAVMPGRTGEAGHTLLAVVLPHAATAGAGDANRLGFATMPLLLVPLRPLDAGAPLLGILDLLTFWGASCGRPPLWQVRVPRAQGHRPGGRRTRSDENSARGSNGRTAGHSSGLLHYARGRLFLSIGKIAAGRMGKTTHLDARLRSVLVKLITPLEYPPRTSATCPWRIPSSRQPERD